jgi:hypothetical protein
MLHQKNLMKRGYIQQYFEIKHFQILLYVVKKCQFSREDLKKKKIETYL